MMKSLSGSELHLSLRMDSRSTFLHQARDPSFAIARRFSAINRPIFSISSVRSLPPPFLDLVFFFFKSDFTKGLIHGGSLEDIRIDLLGKHSSEYESVYDSAKTMWAERVTQENLVSSGEVDSSVDTVQLEPSQYSAKKGWALKSTKRGNRMGENVRSYLIEKFNEGVFGGPKADANQVAKEMKVLRGEDGRLVFKPDEWRTANQTNHKLFFSLVCSSTLR